MAKVHVIARFVAREGQENQLSGLLQGMLTPTRSESGCELYELYESDSRGRFYLYETWESQAALDRHMATPHFELFKKKRCGISKGTVRGQYRERDSDRRCGRMTFPD
jgi:quinol monooxygenase YgiN